MQSLAEFQAILDAQDKQAVPIKQVSTTSACGCGTCNTMLAVAQGRRQEVGNGASSAAPCKPQGHPASHHTHQPWAAPHAQSECLDAVSRIEEAMVKGFPFEVPQEYASLPQLKVRSLCWIKTAAAAACGMHAVPRHTPACRSSRWAPRRRFEVLAFEFGGDQVSASAASSQHPIHPPCPHHCTAVQQLSCRLCSPPALALPIQPVLSTPSTHILFDFSSHHCRAVQQLRWTSSLPRRGRTTPPAARWSWWWTATTRPSGGAAGLKHLESRRGSFCLSVADGRLSAPIQGGSSGSSRSGVRTRTARRNNAACTVETGFVRFFHCFLCSPLLPAAHSAGDFVDLVRRGFYTGMEIQRADGFVVQTGKPEGDVSGLPAGKGRAVVLCASERFCCVPAGGCVVCWRAVVLCGAGMKAGQVLSSMGAAQLVSAVLASAQSQGVALVVKHHSPCFMAPLKSAALAPGPCRAVPGLCGGWQGAHHPSGGDGQGRQGAGV